MININITIIINLVRMKINNHHNRNDKLISKEKRKKEINK